MVVDCIRFVKKATIDRTPLNRAGPTINPGQVKLYGCTKDRLVRLSIVILYYTSSLVLGRFLLEDLIREDLLEVPPCYVH